MSEVLSEENQHLVREAFCWKAELEDRRSIEFHGERLRPFNLMRPKLFMDGDMWCALYGDNIQEGLAGFGKTPRAAAYAFDNAFDGIPTPDAKKASHS